MNIIDILFTAFPSLHIQASGLSWLLQIVIVAFVCAIALIYHKAKIKAVRNEKAEMERKMLEKEELLQYSGHRESKAREEADMANRSKRMLVSKIAHDIRTPMNAMMGMASLLKESTLTAENRGFAASVLESGDGLLTLINDILMNDILEYSKVDSGKDLELKDFDLRNSIEEVLDVFGSKAADAGVDLAYSIKDNVPAQLVGDAYRIRQILMNLIENSFRFTAAGEIFVGVNLQSADEDRLNVQFEVKDTGKGMTSERLQKVNADLSSSDAAGNNDNVIGLTLIICKKLVALMGGAITVESRENEATVFRFNILLQRSLQPVRIHTDQQMVDCEGRKVLVVDDNATVANEIKTWLLKWKLKALTASSGEKALELLENNSDIDLVITDLKMPETDGIELSKCIRKTNPSLPIILLNNTGDDTYRQYSNLFSAVINKPAKRHLLNKQINTALRQKSTGSPIEMQKQKQKFSVDFAKQYPLRILIGEDDAMNQLMVKMVVGKLGYQVNICSNGKEILEEVSQHTYDLILMDVQMPEMDGLEATRMIRLCLSEQPVIIAMTANTMQGDREECLRSGMDDYISKPVKLEELVDLFEKWSLQMRQSNNNRLRA